QRVPPPHDLATLGVQSGEATAHAELSTGDTAIDDAVVVERRAGDGVAVLPLLDRSLPHHLAGLHVQGHDVGIELAEEELALAHGQAAIHPAAAHGRDLLVDAGPVFPDDLPGLGVEREDIVVPRDDVHDAVLHEWRGFERVLPTGPGALEAGHPRALELLDVRRVDLLERGVALVGEVAAVGDPVLADRAPQQAVDL